MKVTKTQKLTNVLKCVWLTAYQMQGYLQSSSADRIMRFIRQNPPKGYIMKSRKKKIDGYTTCNEYKLEEIEKLVDNNDII